MRYTLPDPVKTPPHQTVFGGTSRPCRPVSAITCRCRKAGEPRAPPDARVYIYRSPLIGWERVAEALGPASDSVALHAGIIICSDADTVVLHDFVPADPTSPTTAARLLAGGSVPGMQRRLVPDVHHQYRLQGWCAAAGSSTCPAAGCSWWAPHPCTKLHASSLNWKTALTRGSRCFQTIAIHMRGGFCAN
jgi:hypothetical protein